MSLENIVKKVLEPVEQAAVKTASETPISNNTTRSKQSVCLNKQFVEKATHAIRESAKTDYKNLSAAFKAYVNYNNLPADKRNMIYVALFGA